MTYHISPLTGRPNLCRAEIRCPIGGGHYETKEEARRAYEEKMDSVPATVKKVGVQYDRYDRPLRGTGTGPGGREATLTRMEERPQLSYDEVEDRGEWVKVVSANGHEAFRVRSWEEVAVAEALRDAGAWPDLVQLMAANPDACAEIETARKMYGLEELADDIDFRDGDRDRNAERQDARGMAKYDRDTQILRLALRLQLQDRGL